MNDQLIKRENVKSVTPTTAKMLRQLHASVPKEKVKLIHEEFMKKQLMINDNGVERIANLQNEEDIKKLAEQNTLMVRKEKGNLGDPERGALYLSPSDLPFDAKKHFPLFSTLIRDLFVCHSNSINEIITFMPIMNLPVFTSNLILLITGNMNPKVMDAISVLRFYIAVIKFLSHDNSLPLFKNFIVNHLLQKFDNSSLCLTDLEDFCDHVTCTDPFTSQTKHILIQAFTNGTLTRNFLHSLPSKIESIEPYGDLVTSMDFKEKILQEHNSFQSGIWKEAHSKIVQNICGCDLTSNSKAVDNLQLIMYDYTFKLLHIYETTIMRLYGTEAIPFDQRSSFITQPRMPKFSNLIPEFVRAMSLNRKNTSYNRDVFIGRCNKVTKIDPITQESQEEVVIPLSQTIDSIDVDSPLPSPVQWMRFLDFIEYYAETEDRLREDVGRLKKFIEDFHKPTLDDKSCDENQNTTNNTQVMKENNNSESVSTNSMEIE